MKYKVLIADDEKEIIDFLRLYLENSGFEVLEAYDGQKAYEIMEQESVDLAILDIMMPKVNGFALIKLIREKYNIPVMMLSAKNADEDKILGLGLGADDYITKPFNPLEVCARVEANIRRFYQLNEYSKLQEKVLVRDLELDLVQCILKRTNGGIVIETIDLSAIEFKLMCLFMKSPGRVFTKQQIYEKVWEDQYITDDNNIMVYISKLRDKLGEKEKNITYIKTIRGLGYKFEG